MPSPMTKIQVGLAAGVWSDEIRPWVQHYLYDLKLKRIEVAAEIESGTKKSGASSGVRVDAVLLEVASRRLGKQRIVDAEVAGELAARLA